ncbi:MAG: YdeI/OmpD-associated family protein [Actinomycetota bacterium]|nr:YdeI/OmpD-associated family protein [Actinomycetota bacterium]
MPPESLPTLAFHTADEWRAWLAEHHQTEDGAWLRFAKKGSGIPSPTYDEALEVALCFGWIDDQARGLDERYHLQRFTPRRKRSKWSKRNREKATALIASGRMQPAGLREVERAKADGRWDAAYDSPSTAQVPDDLQAELDRNSAAREFFETLDAQNRYAILHRVQDAKRPETRARRIAKFVEQLSRGERVHP